MVKGNERKPARLGAERRKRSYGRLTNVFPRLVGTIPRRSASDMIIEPQKYFDGYVGRCLTRHSTIDTKNPLLSRLRGSFFVCASPVFQGECVGFSLQLNSASS